MGGKSSAPAAPDYVGAAQLQGELSKETLNMQNFANRPTINTPFGSQSWSTGATTDPATGQRVTSWTQNNTLAPGLSSALDAQIGLQNDRTQLASGFMDRVADSYSQPFNYASLPQMAQANQPGSMQTSMADYTPGLSTSFNFGNPQFAVSNMNDGLSRGVGTESVQRNLTTGDNPMLPQFDSSYRDTVANQLMQRMQPTHDYQQGQLETKLANQGFTQGSEAYNRALNELNQRQSLERFNALDASGNEAQRLFNMGMGSRQQAFNEDVTGGNFANQASGQAFNQGLAANQFANQATQQAYNQNLGAAQFGNQALQQQYNQNLGSAQFQNQALGQASALDQSRMQSQNNAISQQYGLNNQFAQNQNQLRQQMIAEEMQRRGMSLNEMNALLSGQQVQMPNMPSFSASGRAETPNILGATQSAYDAQLGAYNADQAAFGNLLGAGAQLGSAAFMFSDRRLKSNIKRVGTHAIGVGIYDYTMMGMSQRGVIAQEVQAVRPDLVKRHASGYLTVNYGGL
jgi:Chaperone of endosialidase